MESTARSAARETGLARFTLDSSHLRLTSRASSAAPSLGTQPTQADQPEAALAAMLVSALRAGDAAASTDIALLMTVRMEVAAVYQLMSSCLDELGTAWATGSGSVLAERAATHAAQAVVSALQHQAPRPTACGTVVVAAPPGDRHTLALAALGHLLQQAGRPVRVVDDLPIDELCLLAAEPGTDAVVLSAHTALAPSAARQLLAAVRQGAPDVLVAAGGPGFPTGVSADLVTTDYQELLAALELRMSALTLREREVLLAVADGRTNSEIALLLHVSSATIKTHLDNIYAKTGTEHRAAAVAHALRRGWIR